MSIVLRGNGSGFREWYVAVLTIKPRSASIRHVPEFVRIFVPFFEPLGIHRCFMCILQEVDTEIEEDHD